MRELTETPESRPVQRLLPIVLALLLIVAAAALLGARLLGGDDSSGEQVRTLDIGHVEVVGEVNRQAIVHLLVSNIGTDSSTISAQFDEFTLASPDPPTLNSTMVVTPVLTNSGGQEVPVGGGKVDLSDYLWWQAEIGFSWPDGTTAQTGIAFVSPDPNINGIPQMPAQANQPEAQELFTNAMATLTSLKSVEYSQNLSDGFGLYNLSEHAVDASDPNALKVQYDNGQGFRVISIGETMWTQDPGQIWVEEDAVSFQPPSAWGSEYATVTGFQKGASRACGSSTCDLVTFFIPEGGTFDPAWFAWWIDQSTGQLVQEMMVSNAHYMASDYRDWNQPLGIEPPTGPIGTPTPAK